MELASWWILACTLAIVLSIGAATWALLSALIPPQTRDVRELRARVEELDDDVDQVHGRLNERASRANMTKARDVRAGKQELLQQAAEIVKGNGASPSAAPPDAEAQRAVLRRRFLNS